MDKEIAERKTRKSYIIATRADPIGTPLGHNYPVQAQVFIEYYGKMSTDLLNKLNSALRMLISGDDWELVDGP